MKSIDLNNCKLYFLLFVIFFYIESVKTQIIYVDGSATGINDGSSWSNGFTNLQDALLFAIEGDEIWVASGMYKPTSGTDRLVSFEMKEKVSLYGGFSGNETNIEEREIANNPTILSGDIGVINDNLDNSNNIINAYWINEYIFFDGFIIENGFDENSGGAGFNISESFIKIRNCVFRNNLSTDLGGALYIHSSKVRVRNCDFESNQGVAGGAVYDFSSSMFDHCVFENNNSIESGGALVSYGTNLLQCQFSNNTAASYGGAISGNGFTNINKCDFESNGSEQDGGALSLLGGGTVANCIFLNNYTYNPNFETSGGAIVCGTFNTSDRIKIFNCKFYGNSTTGYGGAIYSRYLELNILNSVFSNNSSGNYGGAIYGLSGNNGLLRINNNSFISNHSDTGGNAIFDWNIYSVPTEIYNCIFYDNGIPEIEVSNDLVTLPDVKNCLTQSPWVGEGNETEVPTFINILGEDGIIGTIDDNYRLQIGSIGIDDGFLNLTDFYNIPEDIAGNPRIFNSIIDRGAYENQNCISEPSIAYAGEDIILCEDEVFIELSAEEPLNGIGKWTLIEGTRNINDLYNHEIELQVDFYDTTMVTWTVQQCNLVSIDTLIIYKSLIIEEPLLNHEENVVLCEGDSLILEASNILISNEISWSTGQNGSSIVVEETGTYFVTASDQFGCFTNSNPVVINIDFGPEIPSINYFEDLYICEGESIELFIPNNYTNYEWNNGNSSNSITVDESGLYNVRVRNTFGCWSDYSPEVEVIEAQSPSIPEILFTDNTTFCDGDSIELSSSVIYSEYLWSNNSVESEITIYESSEITLTGINQFGCENTSELLNVEAISLSPPSINFIGNLEFCAGDSLELQGPNNYTEYYWSNGEFGETITIHESTEIQLSVEDANGCISPESNLILINVFEIPATPIINYDDDLEFCDDESLILSGPDNFDNYFWSNESGNQTHIVEEAVEIWLAVENSQGCLSSNSDSLQITVNPNPPIPVIATLEDGIICSGDSILIEAPIGFTSYDWSNGGVDQSIWIYDTGDYSVQVMDENACVSPISDTYSLDVIPIATAPVVSATDLVGCEGDTIILSAADGFENYLWSNGVNTSTAVFVESSLIQVVGIDEYGCKSSYTDTIEVVIYPTQDTPPISFVNDTQLEINSEADSIYWFLDGVLINTGNTSIDVHTTGVFGLQILENGCLSAITEIEVLCFGNPTIEPINLYPNPNNGFFTIEISNFPDSNADVKIYDSAGKLVLEYNNLFISSCSRSKFNVELPSLLPGIYQVVFDVQGEILQKTLLIN